MRVLQGNSSLPHRAGRLLAPRRLLPLQPGREAEVFEAALEVLIQEGVQHRVEAAVCVAQSHAEEIGGHDGGGFGDAHQRLDQDENVNGRPADHEHGHHDHHQPRDPPQVAVLLPRAGQHSDALQPQDHEGVAHGDDEHRHDEGKDEHADLHQRVPVHVGLREL